MKRFLFSAFVLLTPVFIFSQTGVYKSTVRSNSESPTITVEVIDNIGKPVPNAKVSFCSNLECQTKITNAQGLAFFEAYYRPTFMYAYKIDKGLASARIDQSSAKYSLKLPAAPFTNYQAGDQINNFLDVISTSYGYVDDGLFIKSALDAITKNVPGAALPSLGVPGVFSINPIPVVGVDGKLGLKISGILFEEILNLWKITNPLYKDRVYFEYLPSY